MNTLAKQEEVYPVYQYIGEVIDEYDGAFLVSCGAYEWRAQKAVGCLLQPEIGDKVLVSGAVDSEFFLLCVLERDREITQRIVLGGKTDVMCKKGSLNIAGENGVSLTSPKSLSFTANNINVLAEEGDCSISRLTFLGKLLFARIADIKMLAGKMESLCERFQQKIKRSYRVVEDIDQLKSGKIDYTAENVMSLRGKYSLMSAQEDVKINGERIHMG